MQLFSSYWLHTLQIRNQRYSPLNLSEMDKFSFPHLNKAFILQTGIILHWPMSAFITRQNSFLILLSWEISVTQRHSSHEKLAMSWVLAISVPSESLFPVQPISFASIVWKFIYSFVFGSTVAEMKTKLTKSLLQKQIYIQWLNWMFK